MKKFSHNKKIAIIMTIGIAYGAYLLAFQQIQMYKYNKQINGNSETISQLQMETKKLTKQKERYESDEFKEKIAREKLGYVKPGEKIYIDKSQNR